MIPQFLCLIRDRVFSVLFARLEDRDNPIPKHARRVFRAWSGSEARRP